MTFGADHPRVLALLVLALLPFVRSGRRTTYVGAASAAPPDPGSTAVDWVLRIAAALTFAALVVALSGPFRRGLVVTRAGVGAQVVILLDRSGSMNDTFAGKTPTGGEESKAAATKRLLRNFVGSRPHDLFGVAAFSTSPMLVLPLTDHPDAVRAAIDASDRRGLDFTNMARGLGMALSMFSTERAGEHHVILLVSDGAAMIESHVQDQLRADFQKLKPDLYFLFLRTAGSKGMFDIPGPDENTPQAMPERFLNLFFQTLDVPYRAFQAENPAQVAAAIHQIDELARYPIVYSEQLPRDDLTAWLYATAAGSLGIVLAGSLCQARMATRRPA